MTARERAQRIGRLLREFNLGDGRMDAIEREILAAEREAVERLIARDDLVIEILEPTDARRWVQVKNYQQLEAWLRSRGEG